MSDGFTFLIGDGGDGDFTIRMIHGCRLVFGEVPISQIQMLAHGFSKKALMDIDMAERIGATFVIGEPENLEGLRKLDLPVSEKRQRDYQAAFDLGLNDVAVWLRTGERGLSSNAMCRRIFGVPSDAGSNHPADPSDLRRCMLFLDAADAHDKVSLMADVSPEWARLAANWSLLTATFNEEMATGKLAPRTYELMMSYTGNRAETS
ncbi:hypothetical protein A9R05_43370 (plasmid) [Burkholderia sp. KK1]|uniref:Uncharacterized protein n=1 Tax=Burkholderia sp. M701 TaxID=326454 RepID=V5YNB9_9BURK|nr:hypothetical protein [Burkholderia sp. M701]AQH05846.1 hypothetical protein A9R05_43370 [Burkholderia sp. KK1]BAO19070.1 hypothetical protein [Burkholderia sp. M701]